MSQGHLRRLRWTKGVRNDALGIEYREWETVVVAPGENATYNVETNLAEYRILLSAMLQHELDGRIKP